ncbi:MAG: hypothetical protein ACK4GN_13225 [Runella sp.]
MPYQPNTVFDPVATYGDWKVLPSGEIRNDRRRLRIAPDRLRESDWWLSLRSRPWMATEWNHFIPAWFHACQMADIDVICNFKVAFEEEKI